MMPTDGLDQLAEHDAILLGAVGWPSVPDHISLWGLLIPIRRRFKQYINLRPIRLFEGIQSPIASLKSGEFNMCIVRENNEGEYSQIGGRLYQGTPEEIVIQESVFTVRGVDRTLRYAFELASSRAGKLTSATKSNGIVHTMPFWDERVGLMSKEFPNVDVEEVHIDALAAFFVQRPHTFDVVVGSNLFGDILSDLAAAVAGSIGIAPAANINPEKEHPSMFEPVHGSAPDIAGRGIANPIGQIWSAAMMLDHLGESKAAADIRRGITDLFDDDAPQLSANLNITTKTLFDTIANVEIRANTAAMGGSGVYTNKIGVANNRKELITKNRALVYSIIL
jgi:tartrate dehydrogenase/decarboxylase/D-malate dehydrogenase